MKLAIASLLVGSAAAFSPAAPVGVRSSVLRMAETATETAKTYAKLPASIKPGVVTGQALVDLLDDAKARGYAIPGVNIVGTNSINACMEAAMKYGGPIMVTFSKGGGQFIAGKAVSNANDQASIAGSIAGAKHVHEVAKLYGVPVVVHTDHCQKAWLPWIDGLLAASEEHFAKTGEPLFSSHMLDLSEEPLEEHIAICKSYLEKFAKVGILLEFELGVTGGEEDVLTTVTLTRLVSTLSPRRSSTPTNSCRRFPTAHSPAPPRSVTSTAFTLQETSTSSPSSCTTRRNTSRRRLDLRTTSR